MRNLPNFGTVQWTESMTSNCHTFFQKKNFEKVRQFGNIYLKGTLLIDYNKTRKKEKSVTIWKKSVTIWEKCDNLEKKCDNLGKMCQFEVMHDHGL